MMPIGLDNLPDAKACEKFAIERLVIFLEAGKRVERQLAPYLETIRVRPPIESDLLLMFEAIDDVIELVEHCERHEIVISSTRAPIDSGWSYVPWLHEKASNAKKGLKVALHHFRIDVETLSLNEGCPETPEQWLRFFVHHQIKEAVRYGKTIFEEICGDRLLIGKMAEGSGDWSGIEILELERRPPDRNGE
jgi:hypothetical protein